MKSWKIYEEKIGKKGQLKIQQTAFMLIAITLLFILAGLFFLSIYMANMQRSAEIIRENKAVLSSIFLSGSAEFSCGDYCVNADRLMILKDKEVYEDFWPEDISSIRIRKVYPRDYAGKECDNENYPNCNIYTIYDRDVESEREVDNFVALCRRESFQGYLIRKCELGRLMIGFEAGK